MSELIERARAVLSDTPPEGWMASVGARRFVAELLAEVERLQRACRTLGESIERTHRMVLDITGLHHLIGDDGDGDWAAVWEMLAEMPSEIARLRADAQLRNGDEATAAMRERDEAYAAIERVRALAQYWLSNDPPRLPQALRQGAHTILAALDGSSE